LNIPYYDAAQALERKGILSDRCELNRQIRADNRLLGELKAQVRKLSEAVANTIPAVAERLENIRAHMILQNSRLMTGWAKILTCSGSVLNICDMSRRWRGEGVSRTGGKEIRRLRAIRNCLKPDALFIAKSRYYIQRKTTVFYCLMQYIIRNSQQKTQTDRFISILF